MLRFKGASRFFSEDHIGNTATVNFSQYLVFVGEMFRPTLR